MTTQSDAVAALKRREIDALAVLVDLHQLKARRTAYVILGDRAAAEDVVADAFLKVWEQIGRFDASRPFEPWFYRIVVNLAIDDRRKRARSQSDALMPDRAAHHDELAVREARADLDEQLRALPRIERAVLVLRYYHDLDEAAIAAVLGCPVGTVKSRLHRARQRLRVTLDTEPATSTDTDTTWAAAPAKGA